MKQRASDLPHVPTPSAALAWAANASAGQMCRYFTGHLAKACDFPSEAKEEEREAAKECQRLRDALGSLSEKGRVHLVQVRDKRDFHYLAIAR